VGEGEGNKQLLSTYFVTGAVQELY